MERQGDQGDRGSRVSALSRFRQALGVLGVGLLILGVFTPIEREPVERTLYETGSWHALAVLGAAGAALLVSIRLVLNGLLGVGIYAAVVVLHAMVTFDFFTLEPGHGPAWVWLGGGVILILMGGGWRSSVA